MYYVYRYLDNKEEPVYIGITNDLSNRRRSHRRYSEWYSEELRYQFIEVRNQYIAKTYEEYLINKHSPKGNKACNNGYDVSEISFHLKSDWCDFLENKSLEKKDKRVKKRSVKFCKFSEKVKRDTKLVYDMFFLYRNNIIEVRWYKGKPNKIIFDSKEVKEIVLGVETMPGFTNQFIGYDDNNITEVILNTEYIQCYSIENQQAFIEICALLTEVSQKE